MTLEDCDHNTSHNTGGNLDHIIVTAVVVVVVVVVDVVAAAVDAVVDVVGRINVVVFTIIFLSKMSILFVSILGDVAHAGISSET